MLKSSQAKGMQHVLNIKRDAIDMWKEFDMVPSYWVDCLETVLRFHRIKMFEERLKQKEMEERENYLSQWDQLRD